MAIGKNIKGITIEFAGDTTKLGAAIKDIDNKTKSLDTQLREVDKALKFNPGNTELIAQKQQLLGDKVTETKNRLEALQEAQAKLDDDPAVDKTSQEYMELQREIITTESKLEHFESQLKDLNNIKFDQLGKSVQDVGDKVKNVGENMTKYVTTPIVAGAGASVAAFNEVDNGLDIITKKTGASGKELDAMKESAKNLATEIPTDFETAGSAIGEVNTRFHLTGDELETLSGKFIKFAQLNDVDVSTAVDKTQKAMEAFGMPASQAGDMLDILNKVGQDTGISMDQLADSLVKNAPQLQSMGLDANKAATFLGQLEVSGIDSATALGGLKKAITNGAAEGKTLPEVMDSIKDSIVNATSETDAMNAAVDIFGSKAGPAIATAARNGSLDFDALAESATDAGGSVEKTFDETLDPADKFTTTLNQLKILGYEVGSVLLEALAPVLEKVGEYIKVLVEKWQGLSPQMQDFIIKGALLVAALGPVITVLGGIITGVGSIITVIPKLLSGFGTVIKIFGTLSKLLMANPWMLVAAAAIAAIVLIVKNWDKIKEFFSNLWDKVKEIASAAWEAIKGVLLAVWDGIKSACMAVFDAIKAYFLFIFNIYKTIFTTAFNVIKTVVTTVVNAIKTVVTTVFTTIRDTIKNRVKAIKDNVTGVFTNIKDKVKEIWGKVKDAMISPIESAKEKIKALIDKIKGFFNFHFKIPHIKLPHFSIKPPGWKLSDLLEGSIPSLGIEWYAKGGIFNKPSVIGVGEAGPEAVIPINKLETMMTNMANSIVSALQQGTGQDDMAVFQGNIVIDSQAIATVVTPIINRDMQRRAVLDGRNV